MSQSQNLEKQELILLNETQNQKPIDHNIKEQTILNPKKNNYNRWD